MLNLLPRPGIILCCNSCAIMELPKQGRSICKLFVVVIGTAFMKESLFGYYASRPCNIACYMTVGVTSNATLSRQNMSCTVAQCIKTKVRVLVYYARSGSWQYLPGFSGRLPNFHCLVRLHDPNKNLPKTHMGFAPIFFYVWPHCMHRCYLATQFDFYTDSHSFQ